MQYRLADMTSITYYLTEDSVKPALARSTKEWRYLANEIEDYVWEGAESSREDFVCWLDDVIVNYDFSNLSLYYWKEGNGENDKLPEVISVPTSYGRMTYK